MKIMYILILKCAFLLRFIFTLIFTKKIFILNLKVANCFCRTIFNKINNILDVLCIVQIDDSEREKTEEREAEWVRQQQADSCELFLKSEIEILLKID